LEFLKGAGLDFVRAPRLDIAHCTRLPITIVFLPAADIAQYVGEGNVDLGITGKDIIGESEVKIKELMTLGFGQCRLALLAPKSDPKKKPIDLSGSRIVTSFPNLTKKYFDKLDTKDRKTSIKYVSGSVEAACGLGLADAIVDLVETGTTAAAAGLEEIETIMQSETVLIANPNSTHQKMIALVQARIKGYLIATQYVLMVYNIEEKNQARAASIAPGHESPTISQLALPGWLSVSVMVKAKEVGEVMDKLEEAGAKS
jgi:ATP phosphoribosyltransferase